MKNFLTTCKGIVSVVTLMLAFIVLQVNAQTPTARNLRQGIPVTGKVVDGEGQPVIGVTVVIQGTTQATMTDVNGVYGLSVPNEQATLVFSMAGDISQEIAVGPRTTIDVTLGEDTQLLEEVVVVGYSKQAKMTLTGSISAIGQEDIQSISTPTLGEGLLGKVAGISMTQSSGVPGESDPSVFIRGIGTFNSSEPLFIIDGIPNTKRAFMQLNPSSIRDISILKDASATAVYGVKGANGVIIVSTRRGDIGKTTVDGQFTYGIQTPRGLLEFADSYQYSLAYNDMLRRDGETTGEDMLPDLEAEPVEDIAVRRVMTEKLRLCLRLLTEGELALIVKRYYEERSQSDLAAELGLNQSSVCRKEEKILAKLRSLLEK